jgi:hypothetical protein
MGRSLVGLCLSKRVFLSQRVCGAEMAAKTELTVDVLWLAVVGVDHHSTFHLRPLLMLPLPPRARRHWLLPVLLPQLVIVTTATTDRCHCLCPVVEMVVHRYHPTGPLEDRDCAQACLELGPKCGGFANQLTADCVLYPETPTTSAGPPYTFKCYKKTANSSRRAQEL